MFWNWFETILKQPKKLSEQNKIVELLKNHLERNCAEICFSYSKHFIGDCFYEQRIPLGFLFTKLDDSTILGVQNSSEICQTFFTIYKNAFIIEKPTFAFCVSFDIHLDSRQCFGMNTTSFVIYDSSHVYWVDYTKQIQVFQKMEDDCITNVCLLHGTYLLIWSRYYSILWNPITNEKFNHPFSSPVSIAYFNSRSRIHLLNQDYFILHCLDEWAIFKKDAKSLYYSSVFIPESMQSENFHFLNKCIAHTSSFLMPIEAFVLWDSHEICILDFKNLKKEVVLLNAGSFTPLLNNKVCLSIDIMDVFHLNEHQIIILVISKYTLQAMLYWIMIDLNDPIYKPLLLYSAQYPLKLEWERWDFTSFFKVVAYGLNSVVYFIPTSAMKSLLKHYKEEEFDDSCIQFLPWSKLSKWHAECLHESFKPLGDLFFCQQSIVALYKDKKVCLTIQ